MCIGGIDCSLKYSRVYDCGNVFVRIILPMHTVNIVRILERHPSKSERETSLYTLVRSGLIV